MYKKYGDYIKEDIVLYAHTQKGKIKETLPEHMERTKKYFKKIDKVKNIEKLIKNTIESIQYEDVDKGSIITQEEKKFIYIMYINAIYLHDLGKINPHFQYTKMGNKECSNYKGGNTEHSILSAIIYIDIFIKEIKEKGFSPIIDIFMYNFAYSIARHHSYLKDLDEEEFLRTLNARILNKKFFIYYKGDIVEELCNIDENFFKDNKKELGDYKIKEKNFYILNKLLYSLIISCDYYATYDYMNGNEVEIDYIDNVTRIIELYKKTLAALGIIRDEKNNIIIKGNGINRLRTEIFAEAEKQVIINKDKHLFYLEAPTGSGKTNTSINIALTLLEKNPELKNIFYIFPFNTLIDQTAESLSMFTEGKDFIRVNSITPIISSNKNGENDNYEEDLDYEKEYLDYQFMHYPIIMTSHVNIFKTLFGVGREANLLLQRLCNSVIILDEIQAYRNSIWRPIIEMLESYAALLNIKIIIMSATLPKLDLLLGEKREIDGTVNLLKDSKKYLHHPIFKDRVNISYKLIEKGKITLDYLCEYIIKTHIKNPEKKILVEFIKKTTALEFHTKLREELVKGGKKDVDNLLVSISGDDNKNIRKNIIKKIKRDKSIIVISTQVIEAGVDIDMDIGFKDISLFDSEEQFLGRINRSCKKTGEAYFFDYDDALDVYKDDIRLNYSIKDKDMQECLVNKELDKYFDNILKYLKSKSEKFNEDNILIMYGQALLLKYQKIEEMLKLITQKGLQIFANMDVEVDGRTHIGADVWNKYKEILADRELEYGERQIKLSRIYEIMDCFTFNIIVNNPNQFIIKNGEEIGGFIYFDKSDDFIIDGKFDRKKFYDYNEEIIW